MEPTQDDLERFARDYTRVTQSKMRGGAKIPSQRKIRADLKASFPGIGWLTLIFWAIKIWLMLRNGVHWNS